MSTARAVIVAIGALAVTAAASPARSLPVDQYLQLRRKAGYDPRLSYTQIEASPSSYQSKVLELRGIINGSVRREQSVSFLLTLEDKRGLFLTAPADDMRLVTAPNTPRVRVLAKVSEGSPGNVVPLEVLGVAYDGEVTLREREAAARETASQPRSEPVRRTSAGYTASRGYAVRQIASSGIGGTVSELARRYLSPEAQAIYPAYRQFIYGCNKRLTADELDSITVSVLHFSQRHRVDPRLVIAMIIAESDFDPRSTSNKGAMGLGQIMPDEARDHQLTNPYDPIQNVRTSVNLLRMKLDLFREGGLPEGQLSWRQIQLALAAYNAGAGAVKRFGGVPPYRETQGYVKRILKIYTQLIGSDGG